MYRTDYSNTTEGNGLRTVKNGRVKLFGRYYIPDEKHRPYSGELEGVRGYFYKYQFCNIVAFWGTEKMNYALRNDIDYDVNDEPNTINGKSYWNFWHELDDGG